MYFATSGVEVSPFVPPLVALAVSFVGSMGGISGAFLLLPFQMSVLGYTHPSVSGTNQLFNIVAIPSGVYRFVREKRMLWPLAWIIIAGTLPGVFLGAFIRVTWLPDPRHFKLFAAAVLMYIGLKLLRDLMQAAKKDQPKSAQTPGQGKTGTLTEQMQIAVKEISWKKLVYTFKDQEYTCPVVPLFNLSLVIGLMGGIYGIGGGAIMAPILVSWYRLPVHTLGGATLMGTFVTSIGGVLFYSGMGILVPGASVAPDWMLGGLFGLGGVIGMYLGARCQKFLSATVIKWLLCAVIISTATKYVFDFFA